MLRRSLLILALASPLAGCAAETPPPTFAIEPGQYERAFQAAKDVLRDYEFELDRVDGREGVISTLPRQAAGWATPWIAHAQTSDQATQDLIEHVRRVARVSFAPAAQDPEKPPASAPDIDLRTSDGPLVGRFDVTIQRIYRPLRRVGPASIRLSTHAVDPELVREGLQPSHEVDTGPDKELAAKLAQETARRLASGRAEAAAPGPE